MFRQYHHKQGGRKKGEQKQIENSASSGKTVVLKIIYGPVCEPVLLEIK